MDLLKTLKTPTPVFPNECHYIVGVNSDASLSEGFQKLISNSLQALPVRDREGRVAGFLTMLDVVCTTLEFECAGFPEGDVSGFTSTLSEKEHFKSLRVHDIMGKGQEQVLCVSDKDSLDQVARLMAERGAHRAVAVSEKGDLVNVITQSRIAQCMSELWDVDASLKTLAARSIGELGLGGQEVLRISESKPALEAFILMRNKHVSGVAVVSASDDSKLVGNISLHDLGLIKSNGSFTKLLLAPISDYLPAVRKLLPSHSPLINSTKLPGLVKCSSADRFRDVVDQMVNNEVHRNYVVEGDTLKGVVTLTDVLSVLVRLSGKDSQSGKIDVGGAPASAAVQASS